MDTMHFDTLTQELEELKKNKVVNFFKIRKAKSELKALSKKIEEKKKLETLEKTIHGLKLKGLFFQGTKEEAHAAFLSCLAHVEALGCQRVVTYIVEEELLRVVFSKEGIITFPFDELEQKEPLVSLSQLQEIAAWLDNHGVSHAPWLDLRAIEKKLANLMRSCPHGAYMLHAHNRTLTLSRLSPAGRIEHLPIDIQKELGCYTLTVDGKEIAATRIQFKKRLQQMGTPLRLK